MSSVRRFTFITIFATFVIFLAIFLFYSSKQLENSAELIVHEARKDISSLAYTLSKQLKSKDDIQKFRALLDRTQASNNFLKTILVSDAQNILITTNYKYKTVPTREEYYIPENISNINILSLEKVFHEKIVFYEQNRRVELNLFLIMNKKDIQNYIIDEIINFALTIVSISILILLLITYFISKLMIYPLEKLRQYAYYQSTEPSSFYLKELEYIRASMIQTFNRLEDEKKELYSVARTDSLSGLANREYLSERLKWLISESNRSESEFALLFLDLDHFKTINDSLGHDVGDMLLKNVARIIENVIRNNDIVARVGGDEFVIILSQYDSIIELTQVMDRIQTRLNQTQIINEHTLEITSSIGIAFYPKDGLDEIALMKNADIAMYQAKKDGRNQYHFFTQELHEEIQREIQINSEMKKALKNGEFELYYQPKNSVKNNEIIGCEALIRWNHPTKGLVPPNDFIPLAEKDDFIVELGAWILQEAMEQQVKWKESGVCDINMSINVSVRQLFHRNFENSFKEIVKLSKIEPAMLDIEIVESLFLDNVHNSAYLLNMFHTTGASVSLDDFGTGYSSLSYLKEFPIDTLKIDKVFIDDYKSESGSIFLETIIKMGQILKIDVLCEGIETQEQLEYIKSLNCTFYQGYLCSKPVKAEEFETLYSTTKK